MTAFTGEPLNPRRRTPPRPYARTRKHGPSVTTILGALGGKNLEWGSAKESAKYAVHHRDEWEHLDPDEAVDKIRRHFRGVWDGRAQVGTLVHAVNEAWTWGEEAEYPATLDGYVDGLAQFWTDFVPVTVATEEVVRHVDKVNPFIGQRDWVCDLAGERWLLDLKTTAELDPSKGLYFDSWRLQLAAYRHCEEVVEYDEAGTEIATHPAYPVDKCGVLHLRGDGAYTLYEVRAGAGEWNRFLQVCCVHRWLASEWREPAAVIVPAPSSEAVAA